MAKINKEQVVNGIKTCGKLVSGCSSQALICGICRAVLPPQVNIAVKGIVLLGGLLVGGFVGEHVEGYVEKTIDDAVNGLDETAQEVKRCVDVIRDKKEETKEEGVG